MATLLHNLEQTERKRGELLKIKEEIIENYNKGRYIKNIEFDDLIKYLRYTFKLCSDDIHYFYRVRKIDKSKDDFPFNNRGDLIYPKDQDINRMNLKGEQILYTSINPMTAMAEAKLEEGDYFQLTKFKLVKDVTYYELGIFSELYFNFTSIKVRDDYFKGFTGEIGFDENLVKFNSALEVFLCDLLYDKNENSSKYETYIIPAHISKNIFECLNVQAIKYPTVLNRYGTNFIFNKIGTEFLKIDETMVLMIEKKYSAGFYTFKTLYKSISCENENNIIFTSSCTNQSS
jgi:hypothetical protein